MHDIEHDVSDILKAMRDVSNVIIEMNQVKRVIRDQARVMPSPTNRRRDPAPESRTVRTPRINVRLLRDLMIRRWAQMYADWRIVGCFCLRTSASSADSSVRLSPQDLDTHLREAVLSQSPATATQPYPAPPE